MEGRRVAALARGEGEGSERQRGRDRYATSKLMNTVTAKGPWSLRRR
ncbi:hypothetical protein [Sorangium sp. So ce542]